MHNRHYSPLRTTCNTVILLPGELKFITYRVYIFPMNHRKTMQNILIRKR